MANEDATKIWTNGYIVLGTSTRIPVQEVSIDLSRDLKEHYNSGVSKPSALVPGQEKIEFKIKRIFSNTTLTFPALASASAMSRIEQTNSLLDMLYASPLLPLINAVSIAEAQSKV